MEGIEQYFAANYAMARTIFLNSACKNSNTHCTSYKHPLRGPAGETLAIDTVYLGPENADKLFILLSGTHGLEGLLGSAIQTRLLETKLKKALPENTAVLLIHSLNPWGIAHGRRQNEDNIDLNRNFVDFEKPLPANLDYTALHPIISCPALFQEGLRDSTSNEAIEAFIEKNGEVAFHTALFMGQYTHPTGVGFGGQQPSWSNRTLQKILKACQRHASKVVVIDIHSGLGPFGEGLLLSCSAPTSKDFQLAQQWFGSKVMAVKSDPNLPYSVNGDVLSAVIKHFPYAESIAIALEYGTFEVHELMSLQIDDTWCKQFAPDSFLAEQVKEQLWRFFYPDSVKWQQMVLEQGEAAFEKAMQYLAA